MSGNETVVRIDGLVKHYGKVEAVRGSISRSGGANAANPTGSRWMIEKRAAGAT